MLDIILITVGLLGLAIATTTDIKIREVPDWLSYSLIISGFVIRLLYSLIYNDFFPLIYLAIAFLLVFTLANILYYTKQWGGGDAKMLMALSTLFAIKPSYLPDTVFPFLLILITNVFFTGALYGIIIGIFLAFKKRNKFKEELFNLIRQRKTLFYTKLCLSLTLIFFIFIFLFKFPLKFIFIFLTILAPFYLFLWICTKTIEKISMYKRRTIDKVRLGDWLADDIIHEGEVILERKPEGLTNFDIKRLKYHNIKTIIIKEGIPFLPPFLLATILTLIRNKILFLF